MSQKEFKFKKRNLHLEVASYSNNHRLYVGCYNTINELFNDITINLPDYIIPDIEYGFIDSLAKDCGLEDRLIKLGIIKEVFVPNVNYNLGRYDLVTFNLDKLKEYDPSGYDLFIKNSEDINLTNISI